jgi:hypothetical protein
VLPAWLDGEANREADVARRIVPGATADYTTSARAGYPCRAISVENQIQELGQVAKRRGWSVVEIYRDAGISGGNGSDTADYFQSTAGLTVDLATPVNNTGEAIGDSYTACGTSLNQLPLAPPQVMLALLAGCVHHTIADNPGAWEQPSNRTRMT